MEREGDSTPSPTRKSQAAALREKHQGSPGNASVASDVTVFRTQPSMQALSIASSVSDKDDFSTHGTQIALQATIRLPQWGNLSKRDEKTNIYITRVSDKHDELLQELDIGTEMFESVAAKRDRHNDEANPAPAATINKEYLGANARLCKAEREYHGYSAEINELRQKPQMSRIEAHAWHDRKLQEKHEREEEAKKHESSTAELRSLKRQAKKDEESIAYLKEQLRNHELNSMRSILAQRREITQTGEHATALQWETARLTSDNRELKALNQFLQRQNEAFENNPNYCNPAWEDPDNEGVTNANAARRLAEQIADKLGGEEGRAAIDAVPRKDTFGEIFEIKQQLWKYRVLKVEEEFGTPEYWRAHRTGKSVTPASAQHSTQQASGVGGMAGTEGTGTAGTETETAEADT